MAISSVSEQPRQAVHLLGASPEFVRTFEVQMTEPVAASLVLAACGVSHGSPHPDFPSATCFSVEVNESFIDRQDAPETGSAAYLRAEVVAKYRVREDSGRESLPWQRADVWKFQTQGVAVPALFYYDGQVQRPLTNSAGDYFEGLTVDEAQQKITIQSNRLAFPSALAAAVTNCVNDGSFLGFATDCVKVQGISGEMVTEVINEQSVTYWKITAELLGRQTGWNLLLPDVGFNFIEGGERKRAWVLGPDDEKIPSANPVALNGQGGLAGAGAFPEILVRRIYPQISMSSFFGTPPT